VIDNLDFIIRVREIELWLLQIWARSIIVNITVGKVSCLCSMEAIDHMKKCVSYCRRRVVLYRVFVEKYGVCDILYRYAETLQGICFYVRYPHLRSIETTSYSGTGGESGAGKAETKPLPVVVVSG
jgi:hypothetical protein